jgi:hypothetical protein
VDLLIRLAKKEVTSGGERGFFRQKMRKTGRPDTNIQIFLDRAEDLWYNKATMG